MSDFLPQYQKVDPTTWAYLSSLLIIGLFFKFNRIWSVRNLDLVLLILLAPGLILTVKGYHLLNNTPPPPVAAVNVSPVNTPLTSDNVTTLEVASSSEQPRHPPEIQRAWNLVRTGFLWLLGVSFCWLIRLLIDPTMVRRPLLDPNLSMGGMLFIGIWLYFFLMANVITGKPESLNLDLEGAQGAKKILANMAGKETIDDSNATLPSPHKLNVPGESSPQDKNEVQAYRRHGPGYYLVHALPRIATVSLSRNAPPSESADKREARTDIMTAKIMAIVLQLAIIVGMMVVGYWHFDSLRMGIGAATLYMMLPYTSQMTGHVDHALPAALVLWAVVLYRHPLYAGMILGLGMGTSYFALYLLPLWISFYWQRGLGRFLTGVATSLACLAAILFFTSSDTLTFRYKFQAMFGIWPMAMEGLKGIWYHEFGWDPIYRVPLLAAFVVLIGFFAAWPAQKNLGTLLSCSAAVMVAAQFWHGYEGGLYIAWYMPLTLLTIFRPNLEDRVAVLVLGEGWFPRSRLLRIASKKAA
jgi:hypothetical protein